MTSHNDQIQNSDRFEFKFGNNHIKTGSKSVGKTKNKDCTIVITCTMAYEIIKLLKNKSILKLLDVESAFNKHVSNISDISNDIKIISNFYKKNKNTLKETIKRSIELYLIIYETIKHLLIMGDNLQDLVKNRNKPEIQDKIIIKHI